jgi:CDP-4-dehydro-6-deoxyglucose reductase, E3
MPYNVRLSPSEVEFSVQDGQSILDAALAENITLEYSCSNGQCGECKATLQSGNVEEKRHTADVELKEGQILTCMSYPNSDLVLQAEYIKELQHIKRKTIPAKVDEIKHISDDVLILKFRLPPTANFEYLSGQFIDLMWNGQKRSYSLASNKVINNTLELHIKKVDNGIFSEFLFNALKENQLLRFYGPLGTFFVRNSKQPIIFLCTGSGFAPVKSMVEQLIESNSKRQIYIYWGGRYRKDSYSLLPKQWAKEYENINFTSVYSKESELMNGEAKGYCQQEVLKQHQNLNDYEVYACGSDAMIHDARNLFIEHGLQDENFHSDSFLPSN